MKLLTALACFSLAAAAFGRVALHGSEAFHTERQRPLMLVENRNDNTGLDPNWRSDMLVLVNEIRKKAGRAPIALDEKLNQMAQSHSEYQASIGTMTHADAQGSLAHRASRAGFNWTRVLENVAMGLQTVEQVIDNWATSELHYLNMIGNVTLAGFGVALEQGISGSDHLALYWTQNFMYPQDT
ncbi:hypothetical protein GGI07_004801 [Coemansia sp. Benny D115]|nr:hypothetical protein GGI07_004801 [Coemansia sp. Benny D115]